MKNVYEVINVIDVSAMILQKAVIGQDAIVGAGVVVLDDVEPYTTVVGVPARKVIKKGRNN